MPDITQPTFTLSVAQAVGETIVLTYTDTTDYVAAGELASDYYTKLFPYRQTTTGGTLLTATADNASDNLITSWTVTATEDSWYQGIMVIALLYGQEATLGQFDQGDVTYYNSNFYIATQNIIGSTDPSLITGPDADFVLLEDALTYLSILNYYVSAEERVTEAIKTCTHIERKKILESKEYKCDCKESETVQHLDNYLQAIETEFSLNNYLEMQKNIEKATEICENC